MALIRGRERKDAAAIFTASMADIVFLLIVFFVLTYKVEVDRTKMDLPDTWIRIKVPEKAAVISIAPPDDHEGDTLRGTPGGMRLDPEFRRQAFRHYLSIPET